MAQMKRDDESLSLNTYYTEIDQADESAQHSVSGFTSQATNFIYQSGEQVKSAAQEASEAMKSSFGLSDDDGSMYGGSTNSPANKPNY